MENNTRRRPLTQEEIAERKARRRRRQRRQFLLTAGSMLTAVVLLIVCISMAVRNAGAGNSSSADLRAMYESAALARHSDVLVSGISKAEVYTEVEDEFFDDAVFIGDSVSLKLKRYVEGQREAGVKCLGNAQFFTEGGLGWGNQLLEMGETNSLHGSYNGEKMYTADAVAAMGVKKVYIMLGMNDVALFGVDQSIINAGEICDQILEKSPDVEIMIQSVTPMLAAAETSKFNNDLISEFDARLKVFCEEKGFYYLDIASVVADSNGNLKLDYCSDASGMGLHFTDQGCQMWVDYLTTFPYGEVDE